MNSHRDFIESSCKTIRNPPQKPVKDPVALVSIINRRREARHRRQGEGRTWALRPGDFTPLDALGEREPGAQWLRKPLSPSIFIDFHRIFIGFHRFFIDFSVLFRR